MIRFKEFLTESRSAPLYHATSLVAANKILKDNILYGDVQNDGATAGQKVIFVTRNIKHAAHYTSYNYGYTGEAILVLDQAKLAQRYKIKPIKNWYKDRQDIDNKWNTRADIFAKRNHLPMYQIGVIGANEFEEIIVGGKVTDISNYITKIYVNRDKNLGDMLAGDPRVEYRERI